MEPIRDLMRIIDDNSSRLDEGDYLRICNLLKNIFSREDTRATPKLFDYDNFDMEIDEGDEYYKSHYIEMAKQNDFDFLEFQRSYLFNEFDNWHPIQRISRIHKIAAISHECNQKNIILDEYTPEEYERTLNLSKKECAARLKEIYKRYMKYENRFRELYRGAITERCDKIDDMFD